MTGLAATPTTSLGAERRAGVFPDEAGLLRHRQAVSVVAPEELEMQAELLAPCARVQVWRYDLKEPRRHLIRTADAYRLDLSLAARAPGTSLCYLNHWSSARFEPAGRLFLLPPGETLGVNSVAGAQAAVNCYLPFDRISELVDADIEWTESCIEASRNVRCGTVTDLLLQMAEEARNPGFGSVALSEALAVLVAINLHRFYSGIARGASVGGLAAWRLALIDERLRDEPRAPSLSELSALCGLSVRQLSRGFRSSRGQPLGEYVALRSMENAKAMLGQSTTVKAVAYRMGFATPASFCYAFRKTTGMTPGQFQRLESDRSAGGPRQYHGTRQSTFRKQ